jgi:hypothetical protein
MYLRNAISIFITSFRFTLFMGEACAQHNRNKRRTSASGVEHGRHSNPHDLNETYDIMMSHVVFVRQCLLSIHSQFIFRSVC